MEGLRNADCAKVLRRNGFSLDHQSGSHQIWKRSRETIAIKFNNVNRMIWKRLCKENNIGV